jgi:hypothetical protein
MGWAQLSLRQELAIRTNKKRPNQVDGGPSLRERKLFLLVFFLRIALFANLLGLGSFLAALVFAFLASFLGLVAATLGAGAQGSSEKREGAGNHREQFNALHIGPMICCVLQDITGFWTNTCRYRAPSCPIRSCDLRENARKSTFCK